MTSEKLQSIINEGEGYLVEFKESLKGIDKEVCAFANASGGSLYIGITDSGHIKKTTLTNTIKSQIHSTIHSLDPEPKINITKFNEVIKIAVYESDNKPVKASTGFYLRIGANSQKLTRDEILSFAVKENKLRFDHQLYIDETATNLIEIRQVERFREKAKLNVELDNLKLLENLGLLKRQNNTAYLNHAGILLFVSQCKRIFIQATITVLHMQDPATILEQKIIEGTLFDQVEHAVAFIGDKLVKTPIIERLRREDVWEIPELVVRELVINAVIHRDYFESASDVVIKVFKTHIEISNPGTVSHYLSLDKIYGSSYRRNPLLADIFFHAGYIERAGTGLLRAKEALKTAGLPDLKIFEEGLFFVAVVRRRTKEASLEGLNNRQIELLELSDSFFPFSAEDYAARFGVSPRTARADIKKLIDKKLIKKIHLNKQTKYEKS
ncbi:MAG: RNA-binding domain-containing protein [bacterium]|nr:putative DNA binding domain-containing protein [bacterium]MBU1918397.1 putative DNA binding domain-containing protein [bacterium]